MRDVQRLMSLSCGRDHRVAPGSGVGDRWVDDVIEHADRWRIEFEHPGPALLYDVDPAVGLTAADIALIADRFRRTDKPSGEGS